MSWDGANVLGEEVWVLVSFLCRLITNLFPNHNIELSDLPEVIEAKAVLY